MTFDVGKVRAAYPALTDGYAYMDGAAGTQLPEPVIDAVAGVSAWGGELRWCFPGEPPLRHDH
jgi:selenocysteine lyase/cysteine desulfurase